MPYALLFATLCCVCASCAQSHGMPSAQTLRIGMGSEPNTLNPVLAAFPEEVVIDNLIFDPLLTFDMQGRATAILATEVPSQRNGGISPDGLTVTYHLRSDARWHDGVPVTSRDVVFSYNAVMNPRNDAVIRYGYSVVRSVAAPDPHTVVFHLKKRFAPILSSLFGQGPAGYVIPAHLLAQYPSLNRVDFNQHPIGDGAFRLISWHHGESIELAANDRYYRGLPRLQRISIRFIPDDNTRVLQLRSHDIDFLFGVASNVYPQLLALRRSGTKTVRFPTMGWNAIAINLRRSPLDDVRVRRALAMGFDKAAIVHRVLHDAQPLANEDIPSYSWAYAPRITSYRHDVAAAQRLLTAAGWGDRRLHLLLIFDQGNAAQRSEAVQLQSSLAQIGVDLTLKGYPTSVLLAGPGQGGILEDGKFDLALDMWINHSGEPDNSTWLTCGAIDPNGFNDARYCNRQVDRLEQLALTSYDRAERRKAYAQIESIVARDVPYIAISWQNTIISADARFHGLRPGNIELSIANAYQWSL